MHKFLLPFIILVSSNTFLFSNSALPTTCNSLQSNVTFNLEDCFSSDVSPGSAADYSEFTPEIDNSSDCATLEVIGGHLYRNNPDINMHSCSPGINGSTAMCVGISEDCDYVPGDETAIRFDIQVTPQEGLPAVVTDLTFWENAPTEFNWIDGPSGPNDYPTRYAIRIQVNGNTIFEESDIETENEWNQEVFNFDGLSDFKVSETTIFNIELVPYCAIGNGAAVKAWDVDNIQFNASCVIVDGGEISLLDGGTEVDLCSTEADNLIVDINLLNNQGDSSKWIITSDETIVNVISSPPFDFTNFESGIYSIYHISFIKGLQGLSVDESISLLDGCYSLSNSIIIDYSVVDGGEISVDNQTEIDLCISDEVDDGEIEVDIVNSIGTFQYLIITDINGNVISSVDGNIIDFSDYEDSIFQIWNISSADELTNLESGFNVNDLEGCFHISNSITVENEKIEGGELLVNVNGNLSEGQFFCTGDGMDDYLTDIQLNGALGDSLQLIIVSKVPGEGIIAISDSMNYNFENLESGEYDVYVVLSNGDVEGVEIGNTLLDITGCYSLSTQLYVQTVFVQGGDLELSDGGTELSVCAGDGIDEAIDVLLENEAGDSTQWVITNEEGTIIGLPDSPPFSIADEDQGLCQIWSISFGTDYDTFWLDPLTGLAIGENIENIQGCYEFSNPITIFKDEIDGGEILFSDGTETQEVCSGDGASNILDVNLNDNQGTNTGWIITDEAGVILNLPSQPPFNFEGAEGGSCLIWHISYADGIEGLEVDSNAFDLSGCFDLSNSLTVIRTFVDGGMLSTTDTLTELIICADDGESDSFDVSLTNAQGANTAWVITNNDGIIQELPGSPPFDFEGSGSGACQVWNISYENGIEGLEIGFNVDNIIGCKDFSNPITVTKLVGDNCDLVLCDAEGGQLSFQDGSSDTTICVGEGIIDTLNVMLTGETGEESGWIITDIDANILALPDNPPFNLEDAEAGTCLIWHISYNTGLDGLEVNNNIVDLDGCYDLSNSLLVQRLSGDDCDGLNCDVEGGVIAFANGETETTICVGDAMPDTVNVILSNESGTFSQWIVTSVNGVIMELLDSPPFDLEGTDPGVCLVYHISHEDNITGLAKDSLINNLGGCYDISNAILINKLSGADCDNIGCDVDGGLLASTDGLTEIDFCSDDDIADSLFVNLTQNMGSFSQWLITDASLNIISLPDTTPIILDSLSGEICLLWNISYESGLIGLEIDSNALDIEGCYDLSNAITITKFSGADCFQIDCEVSGGSISFADTSITQFEVCVADGESDIVNVDLDGASGDSTQWIITDNNLLILDLPENPPFDFEDAAPGICFIWNVSYDTIVGLEVGMNAGDLVGCYDLSNNLTVVRKDVEGGNLTFSNDSTSVQICVQDGIPDSLDVTLTEEIGDSLQWIITDENGKIIGLPDTFPIDFESNEEGICFIYNISSNFDINGVDIDSNIINISGCYDLSNSIQLIRNIGENCDDELNGPGDNSNLNFSVNPNPATNEILIEFNSLPYLDNQIYIYDAQGYKVGTYKTFDDSNLRINISEYNSGLFFIRVDSGNQRKIKKFLKIGSR